MKKNLGIIGCGSVVQSMYIYSIPGWKNIADIYVYDLDERQSAKVAKTLNACVLTLDNLLQKADIIIITTPPHTHFDLLNKCMLPGKTVICEKPFLLNFTEAQEIIQLAKKTGTQLFVAHLRRVLPAANLAKQVLESGILGEIKEIQLFEGTRFAYQTKSGYETNNPFGGVLPDTGSHTLDLALFVAGWDEKPIQIIDVITEKDKAEPSHEMKANFILQAENKNIPVKLSLSRKQTLANKINIIAENGILEMPVGLQNTIRISKPGQKAFVANASYEIANYHQAMALEYDMILDDSRNHIFKAERFINLALIIEKLLD